MHRFIPVALIVMYATVSLVAQSTAGWQLRVDGSTSAADPDAAGEVKFMATDSGFHTVNPQAAVFWNPENSATGTYTLRGQFTQLQLSDHTNHYGLVFGGSNLEAASQSYMYFMVAQDGTWLIKRRNGGATEDVEERSSPAVRRSNPNGMATNLLEVRVTPQTVVYSVNGTTVHTMPKASMPATTDGLYGFRVNHRLEVQVDNFGVS